MITLRDYQTNALAAIHKYAAKGITRQLVVLPTGTGKTCTFAHLIHERTDLGPALVIAHRDELIRQAADKLHQVDPSLEIGIVQAERNEVHAPVIVASVQSLHARRRAALPKFATVIVDEAHHSVAKSYRSLLEHVGIFKPDGPLCVGWTATPKRADRKRLNTIFQKIVYKQQIGEMILRGYLCDVRAKQVVLDMDLTQVRQTRFGDWDDGALASAIDNARGPEIVVEAFLREASDRKAVVYTPTVALAEEIAQVMSDHGVAAEFVSGAVPIEERQAILSRLHQGETQVVANCMVLTEGWDEPSVNCVIVARPTKSQSLFIQMVGRGLRLYPGKDDLLVLDVVGNTKTFGLQTTATLAGVDPKELEHKGAGELIAARRTDPDASADSWAGELRFVEVDLLQQSRYVWRQDDQDWVLRAKHVEARLKPVNWDTWAIWVTPGEGQIPVLLEEEMPLDLAQGVAEDWMRTHAPVVLIDARAPWRALPPTERQIATLRRAGLHVPDTRGEASLLLDKMFAQMGNGATPAQLKALHKLGIEVAPGISKAEATKLLTEAYAAIDRNIQAPLC